MVPGSRSLHVPIKGAEVLIYPTAIGNQLDAGRSGLVVSRRFDPIRWPLLRKSRQALGGFG